MPQPSPTSPPRPIWEHTLRECLAMTEYAFAAGMKVPPDLSVKLDSLGTVAAPAAPAVPLADATNAAADEAEAQAARHAPTPAEPDPQTLTLVHNRLADLVAPATPKTILLLATEQAKSGPFLFLGAVPMIRRLMALAALSMFGFGLVSLSENVDGSGFNLLQNSGLSLFLSEIFLLSAASIGASFANLFQAQRYIKDGTFDPKYESSYWVRYVLGLMAGTILALLIPVEALAGGQGDSIIDQLGKPILALLGGFAAAAVYRILHRMVAALESLVSGDTHDQVAAEEQAAKSRLAERQTQDRMNLSLQLIALEEKLGTSADPAIRSELKKVQHQLIKGEEDVHPEPS